MKLLINLLFVFGTITCLSLTGCGNFKTQSLSDDLNIHFVDQHQEYPLNFSKTSFGAPPITADADTRILHPMDESDPALVKSSPNLE